MMENTNQRKIITGASVAYRYTHIAGLSNLIITFVATFVGGVLIGFIEASTFPGMNCTSNCPTGITDMDFLLIALPIHIVFSLIAFLAIASVIRERYNFCYDQWALLKGGVHFFVWTLIPTYIFWGIDDTSPYHSVSTGAYLLLIILYYCVGFYAFRKKTGVEPIEKNKT